MKQIKLVFSVLFVCMISVSSIFAQTRGEAIIEKKMAHMTENLELTDKQQTELRAILTNGMKKQIALKEKEGDRNSKKEEFKAIREEQFKAIEGILTKEQLVTFEKEKKEHAEKRAEMRKQKMAKREKLEKVDKKALKLEMKTYMDENIRPVISEKRSEFDQKMTDNEKKTINEVRAKLAAQKEEFASFKKSRKKRDALSEADKAKMKAAKEAMKTEITKVKVIAEKYETELKTIRDDLTPQSKKWKEDMKEIAKKYGVERNEMDKRKKEEGRERSKEKKDKKTRKGHHKKGHKVKELSPVKFLLMNPDEAPKATKETSFETSIKVFPNPAQSFNNVQFNLVTGGDVVIELHDQDGNLVKTVLNEYRPAGTHTVKVNLGELTGFVYLYVLKDAEGNILTEKFVLRK